jgi:hypothetical protein
MLGVSGIGGAQLDVTGRTMLQRVVPDEKLTRSLGVLESAYMGTEGLGAAAAAALIAVGGCGVDVRDLRGRCSARRLGAPNADCGPSTWGARVPADDLELLGRTSLFEPLPPSALERLARNSFPVQAVAGQVVIREGDAGDRLYVIAEGGDRGDLCRPARRHARAGRLRRRDRVATGRPPNHPSLARRFRGHLRRPVSCAWNATCSYAR